MTEERKDICQNIVTYEELSKHNSEESCWIVIHGVVYDMTEYLHMHPGGPDIITECGGKDATSEFEDNGHSRSARKIALKYEIGVLEGHEQTAIGADKVPRSITNPNKAENSSKENKNNAEKNKGTSSITKSITETPPQQNAGQAVQTGNNNYNMLFLIASFCTGLISSLVYYYYFPREY